MPEASPNVIKAFVISPIGERDGDLRRHADRVQNQIIREACRRLEQDGYGPIVVERSDHVTLPGLITDQVIASIVRDRIVFAVLAGDRPNVYYELAVALAAGRHVIVLRNQDEKTHFDIKDVRTVEYRYDAAIPAPEHVIKEVSRSVRSVLDAPSHHPIAFGRLDPLGRNYLEYEFKEAFRDISIPDYSELFLKAKNFIGLQGISLLHFTRANFPWNTHDGGSLTFFDIIRAKVLFDAVSVRIVMMHENNEALPHLIKFIDREKFTESMRTVRDEIRQSYQAWSELRDELEAKAPERADGRKGRLEVTRLIHGLVNYRLTITDEKIVVTPYLNIFPFNSQGPALICQADTPFYDRINREFLDRAVSNERAAAALKAYGNLEIAPPTRAAE
jgi:hypothetical protein